MQLVINGESFEAADESSIAILVTMLQLDQQRLAIEVNGEIVPRGLWSERRLVTADRVEIVRAIGGG